MITFVSSIDCMNFKNFSVIFLVFIVLIAFSLTVSAHVEEEIEGHEEEHTVEPVDYLPFDPFELAKNVFFLVFGVTLISIGFQSKLSDKIKKFFFILVVFSVGVTTIYAAATTVYLNVISESEGPIHWHADYEIWVCGQQIKNLKGSEGLSNKVGTSIFHHHNDFRIHAEGIVIKKDDVSLGKFFKAIGGGFDGDALSIVLNDDSVKTFSNGDLCNGLPGKWRLFLKNHDTGYFEENPGLQNYVLKPYFNIPPGDFIKLVFDSKEGVPNGG